MLRFLVPAAWLLSFAALNYTTKRLTILMPPLSEGRGRLALFLLGSPWVYVMVALYVVCAVLYLAGVKIMPLSTAGPLFLIIGVLATTLLAMAFFGESMSLVKGVGIALCLAGAVLILWKSGQVAQ